MECHEKELAENLIRNINNMTIDEKLCAKYLATCHRTLQQSIMVLVLQFIKAMAENAYDLRNEASVLLCQKLVETIEKENNNFHLPFI